MCVFCSLIQAKYLAQGKWINREMALKEQFTVSLSSASFVILPGLYPPLLPSPPPNLPVNWMYEPQRELLLGLCISHSGQSEAVCSFSSCLLHLLVLQALSHTSLPSRSPSVTQTLNC